MNVPQLHCNGFSAHLSLVASPLQPLSTCVNPHAPHAVEGVYAAPLVSGQPWTLAWADDRPEGVPVDASVLVHDGGDEAVLCTVAHGQPTSLRGFLRTGPLKLTLLLRDPIAQQIRAIFVLFCGDNSPRATIPSPDSLLPQNLALDLPHTPNQETLWMPDGDTPSSPTMGRMAPQYSSPESTLVTAAGRRGPDDSGVGLESPERGDTMFKQLQRELDFYRDAVHALERSMSPASHIRFLTERLVRVREGAHDCPNADDRALTVAARVHTAVARERMLARLRDESEVAVSQELAGVLGALVDNSGRY